MTDPVARLRDENGVVHYMSATSRRAIEGLADGSLTPVEEVPDVASDDGTGDSDDAGKPDKTPRDRKSRAGSRGKPANTGVAEPKLGS